ncbi:MAG: hypothetical protein ACLFWF_14140, partial [Alphaproteobacteria bacterium]
ELVVLSGGEPFLKRERLAAVLEALHANGLKAGITTSASWAPTEARARQMLESLKYEVISELAFSADRHHLPFLSLEHVKNGINAALSLGIAVNAFICLDGEKDDFLDRFRAEMGPEIMERIGVRLANTHVAGRAARRREFEAIRRPVPFEDLPDQVCNSPAAPAITPEGRLMACCGDNMADAENWPALQLGDVRQDDYGAMLDDADRDLLIQALRVFGPKHLAGIAIEAGALRPPEADSRNICDICRRGVTNEQALAAIRDWLRDPDVQAEISVRRFLMYEELSTVQSEAS